MSKIPEGGLGWSAWLWLNGYDIIPGKSGGWGLPF